MIRLIVTILCLLLAESSVLAAEKTEVEIPSIPENPSASVLNIDPSKITRPGTPATFAGSLLGAVDENGKLKPGLAVEVAPFWFWRGPDTSLKDWKEDIGSRLASWFSLSLMTAANEDSITVGGGFKLTLMDDLDPRYDSQLVKCLKSGFKKADATIGQTPTDSEKKKEKYKEFVDKHAQTCHEERKKRAKSGNTLALAAVVTGESKEGSVQDIEFGKVHAWLAGSYSFGAEDTFNLELLYGVRYVFDNPDATHDVSAALGFEVGYKPMSIAVRMSWSPRIGGDSENLTRFAVGADFTIMMSEAFGASVSAGKTLGAGEDENTNFLTVNLILGSYGTKTFIDASTPDT